MKLVNRYAMFVIAAVFVAAGVTFFSAQAGAQDEGWQIVRADYGHRDKRNDVTDIVKELIERGGVNGRVAVNNQTMGGDPAVGAEKHLRLFARNRKREEREFDFKEGGFIEVRNFNVNIRQNDWDERRDNYGDRDRDRDDYRGVRIIRAYYGWQASTVNVTEVLRSRMRDGQISFAVTNSALGGDPAVGADKILVVIYRYQGREAAAIVREGNTLTLP